MGVFRASAQPTGLGSGANTGYGLQAGTVYETADPTGSGTSAVSQANATTARWVAIIILVALLYLVVLHVYFRRHLMA